MSKVLMYPISPSSAVFQSHVLHRKYIQCLESESGISCFCFASVSVSTVAVCAPCIELLSLETGSGE